MSKSYQSEIMASLVESVGVKQKLGMAQASIEGISKAAEAIIKSYRNRGQLYLFGNGGSAADAQHIEGELVNKLYIDRPMLSARTLTVSTSTLTAIANDRSYDEVFARQIESLVTERDAVIGISTSGNSENVYRGLKTARERRAATIGLTGRTGGKIKDVSDILITVPSDNVARIQECHITIGHILCEIIEREMFGKK